MILLAENGDPVDRVRAFARGVDDYVSKPFHYEELLARIRAVLRRAALPPVDRIDIAEITIDRPTRRASVSGDWVVLAGKEYELLLKLASEPERVHEGGAAVARGVGVPVDGADPDLDSHASRLRRKLSRDGREYIVNEWGGPQAALGLVQTMSLDDRGDRDPNGRVSSTR